MIKIENTICREWRLRLYGLGVILILLSLVVGLITKQLWPFLPNGNPICIDFGIFWLSGKFAASGDVARIFDHASFTSAQAEFFDPGSCPIVDGGKTGGPLLNPNRFWYPPVFLLFVYPFGMMKYSIALAVWIIVSFALYVAAVYMIISRSTAVILAATPFVLLANVYLGQNGFFTAALIGFSLVFMERRPLLAGVFLGLLTYKPHFGVLFPIALLASRNWRALGSALSTTVALSILATMVFGYEGWISFIDGFTHRNPGLGGASGIEPRLQSVFGMLYLTGNGASTWVSWSVQLGVAAMVALSIWMLWARPISYNLKAAALCAGSFLVTPYVLVYDLCILPIAIAFFVKEGLSRGFLRGERMAILMFSGLLFFMKLPIGPVICTILLLFIARRIVYRRSPTELPLEESIAVPA
ncbi:MAG: DUF2029 domain-containing protein [Deltaproteobacteria bacterium]|nr:DUF2029 domain-containing protein [Deltaproteobacteria bacterium]